MSIPHDPHALASDLTPTHAVVDALHAYLGDGAEALQVDRLCPGLRLSGRAPPAVAGRAVVWAVRLGFDPVEDDITRDPALA